MRGNILWLLAAVTQLTVTSVTAFANNSNAIYTWEGGRIEWPCPTTKRLVKAAAKYTPKDIIAMACARSGDKTLCAMPRYRNSIPITLGQIYATKKGCDVKFEPFPCWTEQEENNCNSLQSVIDIYATGDFVWVLDNGILNALRSPIQRCPAKIVVYEAKTGKKMKTINLGRYVTEKSRLQYMQVECLKGGQCFVYISDAGNNAIIIYDVSGGRGYRVVLPKAVHHGCRFRDVLYIFLSYHKDGTKLFFTYLGGRRLFAIATDHLRKGHGGNIEDIGEKPGSFIYIGPDGATGVFFREEGDSNVFFWDTKTCLKKSNFKLVFKSSEGLYATDVFPDHEINRFLILESDFPGYMEEKAGCGTLHQISLLDGATC
ncbi:AAEL007096-PA [Aedes aegypti]|uniref:AAEL007096-PA n=2 Tax=Aedes aegypti TaxID=7159 RepID=A0A1S4FFM5_AEDAE|nr:major royal jelly protein 3 [Aedes aegypti]EAT41240.1 AAEL007096-PA [Aedes aegypti]